MQPQPTDLELIQAVLAGTQSAYAALVNRHKRFVFTMAMKFVRNREDAEEIAQDSFVKAYKALGTFQQQSKFSTWLYAITYTTANMNSDPAMNPTEANIRILGPDGTTVVHKATVKIGESFGLSPKDGKRFKLLGYEKKTFPGFADDTVEENVISVQDTETAGPEKQFTVRAGNPNPKLTGDAAKGHLVSDTTATLRVTGGSALGTPKATVKAELNAEFTIPGGAGDGKDLKATFVSTDPTGGINVTPAGAQAPICIPKVKAKHAEE